MNKKLTNTIRLIVLFASLLALSACSLFDGGLSGPSAPAASTPTPTAAAAVAASTLAINGDATINVNEGDSVNKTYSATGAASGATLTWSLNGNYPSWLTMVNGTIVGAAPIGNASVPANPYTFMVTVSDGVNTVNYPVILTVVDPCAPTGPGGGTHVLPYWCPSPTVVASPTVTPTVTAPVASTPISLTVNVNITGLGQPSSTPVVANPITTPVAPVASQPAPASIMQLRYDKNPFYQGDCMNDTDDARSPKMTGQQHYVAYLICVANLSKTQAAYEQAITAMQSDAQAVGAKTLVGNTITPEQESAWLIWVPNATNFDYAQIPNDTAYPASLVHPNFLGQIWLIPPHAGGINNRTFVAPTGVEFWAVAVVGSNAAADPAAFIQLNYESGKDCMDDSDDAADPKITGQSHYGAYLICVANQAKTQAAYEQAIVAMQADAAASGAKTLVGNKIELPNESSWLIWIPNATGFDYSQIPNDTYYPASLIHSSFLGQIWIIPAYAGGINSRTFVAPAGVEFWAVAIK